MHIQLKEGEYSRIEKKLSEGGTEVKKRIHLVREAVNRGYLVSKYLILSWMSLQVHIDLIPGEM